MSGYGWSPGITVFYRRPGRPGALGAIVFSRVTFFAIGPPVNIHIEYARTGQVHGTDESQDYAIPISNQSIKQTTMNNQNKAEWMFRFEGGGWNAVWAVSREEAIQLANEKYGRLKPIEKSFMEVEKNKEVYKNYLSMFW